MKQFIYPSQAFVCYFEILHLHKATNQLLLWNDDHFVNFSTKKHERQSAPFHFSRNLPSRIEPFVRTLTRSLTHSIMVAFSSPSQIVRLLHLLLFGWGWIIFSINVYYNTEEECFCHFSHLLLLRHSTNYKGLVSKHTCTNVEIIFVRVGSRLFQQTTYFSVCICKLSSNDFIHQNFLVYFSESLRSSESLSLVGSSDI